MAATPSSAGAAHPRWRRVLAMRPDNVGDVIMLGPALRALRASLPEAHITLLASPAGAQVAPMLAPVDEVMVERVVWQDASGRLPLEPARERRLVERIAAGSFDAALVFTSWAQSPWPAAYACYLAGVPVRAGESKEFGGSLLTHTAEPLGDEAHQVDRNLHLLQALGIPPAGRHLDLALSADAEDGAARLLADVGVDPAAPFVCLAPGASCAARRYPPQRYAEVAALLADGSGLPVVVVGSEREIELARPITACGHAGVRSLVGGTAVSELAAVVARSELVVANDSGPMHLGDAFERPMVVLYSGTELESQWRPRRAPSRLLRRPTPCSPCYRFDCPYDMACLDIPPEEVVHHALALLEESSCVPSKS